jgi:hypothetical protein
MDTLEQAGYLEIYPERTYIRCCTESRIQSLAFSLPAHSRRNGIPRMYPGFGGRDFWRRDESKLYDTTIAA